MNSLAKDSQKAAARVGLTSDTNFYTVDTGAGLVFKIRRTDNRSSTQSAGGKFRRARSARAATARRDSAASSRGLERDCAGTGGRSGSGFTGR